MESVVGVSRETIDGLPTPASGAGESLVPCRRVWEKPLGVAAISDSSETRSWENS